MANHWWAQRVSAIALVPLLLWLIMALAGGSATDYVALTTWLGAPLNTILLILLLIAAFHHSALGLQIIAEDYIHSRARFAVIACVQLACAAAGGRGDLGDRVNQLERRNMCCGSKDFLRTDRRRMCCVRGDATLW